MKKDSLITIANRYAHTIKEEIRVLRRDFESERQRLSAAPAAMPNFGFRFHNLACPCEGLQNYWGEGLDKLGFGEQLKKISKIGKVSRTYQKFQEEGDPLGLDSVEDFLIHLEKLIPILFFVV